MKKIIRTTLFGGLNKKEVEEYISSLEQELEEEKKKENTGLSEQDKKLIDASITEISKLKEERDAMRKQIAELSKQARQSVKMDGLGSDYSGTDAYECFSMLEKENKELRTKLEEAQSQKNTAPDPTESITRALCDAKAKSDEIVKNANEEASKIVTIAEYEASVRKKKADEAIKKELVDKVEAAKQLKLEFAECAKGIEEMHNRAARLAQSLQLINDDLPGKIMGMLEEKEDKPILDANYTEVGGQTVQNDSTNKQEAYKDFDVWFRSRES